MAFSVSIASATFNGGQTKEFGPSDLVIFVGGNNAGKSKLLTSLHSRMTGITVRDPNLIVRSVQPRRLGTLDNLWERICRIGTRHSDDPQAINLPTGDVVANPDRENGSLDALNPIYFRPFVGQLTTSNRIVLANAAEAIDFGREAQREPLHRLHQNPTLRQELNRWFKRAFGSDIAVDLMAGRVVPLHVGESLIPSENETEICPTFIERLRATPRLDEQGDGMRSFVGVLAHIMLADITLAFVDEPEAFLHPPQARLLGRLLGSHRPRDMQLFVATHSADFLRGALDSDDPNLRIIRVRRSGNVNVLSELTATDIQEAWSDPVLRYSNVLDGVFHEKVVVCEADGDCRFYGAVADALREPDDHTYIRDVMFTQAGGKGGIPKIVAALRRLNVPVAAVADFDVLRVTGQLRKVIEAFGGDYASFQADIQTVRADIDAVGTRTVAAIKTEIAQLISQIPDDASEFPTAVARRLSEAARIPPGWARAKKSGLGFLTGEARIAADRLLTNFARLGLYIVPTGDLESLVPSETADKNAWVNSVLETYNGRFTSDPLLDVARNFVAKLISHDEEEATDMVSDEASSND